MKKQARFVLGLALATFLAWSVAAQQMPAQDLRQVRSVMNLSEGTLMEVSYQTTRWGPQTWERIRSGQQQINQSIAQMKIGAKLTHEKGSLEPDSYAVRVRSDAQGNISLEFKNANETQKLEVQLEVKDLGYQSSHLQIVPAPGSKENAVALILYYGKYWSTVEFQL